MLLTNVNFSGHDCGSYGHLLVRQLQGDAKKRVIGHSSKEGATTLVPVNSPDTVQFSPLNPIVNILNIHSSFKSSSNLKPIDNPYTLVNI